MTRKTKLIIFASGAAFGLAALVSGGRDRVIEQVARDTGCPAAEIVARHRGSKSSYWDVEACGKRCTYYRGLWGDPVLISCP